MPKFTFEIEVSDENISALKEEYNKQVGEYPTKEWVATFFKAYIEGELADTNGTFLDELCDIVNSYL